MRKIRYRQTSAALFVLGLACGFGCSNEAERTAAAIRQFEEAAARGQRSAGLDALDLAILREPNEARLRLVRCRELLRRRHVETAEHELEIAAKDSSLAAETAPLAVEIAFAARRDREGLNLYLKLPAAGRAAEGLTEAAASAADRLGDFALAADLRTQAAEASSERVDLRLFQAEALLKAGRLDDAYAIAETIAGGQVDGPRALAVMAGVRREQGRLGEAESLVKKAVAAAMICPQADLERGRLERRRVNVDGALAAFRQASLFLGSDPVAVLELAELLREAGRIAEAAAVLAGLPVDAPANVAVLRTRARVAAADGRWGDAKKDLDRLSALNPRDADGYNDRGAVHKSWEAWESALADFDRALAQEADRPEFLWNRAEVLRKLDRLPEAERDEARAVELSTRPAAPAASPETESP